MGYVDRCLRDDIVEADVALGCIEDRTHGNLGPWSSPHYVVPLYPVIRGIALSEGYVD